MLSLGIDVGYSSVKLVALNAENKVEYRDYRPHKGRPREVLLAALDALEGQVGEDAVSHGALTGSGCKSLAGDGAVFVNEVASLVDGALWADPRTRSVAEIGGQGAKFVTQFDPRTKNRIEMGMNPNCSSGTGSFLEEQVSRLGLDIEDYSRLTDKAKSIPRIAGRCSVFAKTDITHHQQEGVSVEDILLGLAYAVMRNYRSAVVRRLPRNKPIMFAGGVMHNRAVLRAVKDVFKLDDADIIVPEGFDAIAAAGAALIAGEKNLVLDLGRLRQRLERVHEEMDAEKVRLPRLDGFGAGDALDKHALPGPAWSPEQGGKVYLGVDVGSTSTNLVLMDEGGRIVSYRYLRTLGRPKRVVAEGLRDFHREFGGEFPVAGVCVTGSGRYMIGRFVGADVVKDEITAQARAAADLDPGVDTVFEIGGQDSKYISLRDGVVVDFQMNKICAAGTGSFLEEQAKRLGVPVDSFGETALSGKAPITLGERCTVFIESSVAAHLSRGAAVEDLVSGLCFAVVKNYIHRVVGAKPIGDNIFFQGGVAHNQGVVNAFRAITGKPVRVPPFFSVTGAYGAALLAREEMRGCPSAFKGFLLSDDDALESVPDVRTGTDTESFSQSVARVVFKDYDGILDPRRKTIGMPRALFTFGMFPLFQAFFEELGYNVLLSDPSGEETVRLCQEYAMEETCFPVKLINGHVADLVARGVDYIFFPDLYTVMHPGSVARRDYGCAYMQLAFKLVNQAMDLEQRGIKLLAPTIAFSLGPDFMKKTFMKLGADLDRDPQTTGQAMQRGMRAYREFEQRLEENARRTAQAMLPDEKVFVLLSKIYGVADPVLNLGVPDRLREMGYKVLPFYALPEVALFKRHPNMFWPFGQHILESARLVREHPNLYAIFLTHHGCGPDTAFSHYVREIMGEKPYLNIEVDEHSSRVGVITRVEAFVNSLEKIPTARAESVDEYRRRANKDDAPMNMAARLDELPEETVVHLPHFYPYADIFAEQLRAGGINARVLPAASAETIEIGRGQTNTSEYFSLTALLGNVLENMRGAGKEEGSAAVVLPQTEGAEVDGQYPRLLRCALDKEGLGGVSVVAPFLEDLPDMGEANTVRMFACILAGDLVMAAPRADRAKRLETVLALIRGKGLDIQTLRDLASDLRKEIADMPFRKRVFVMGEPMTVFNDHLNNRTFRRMEEAGHRVLYAPLSEYLWTFWTDFLAQRNGNGQPAFGASLKVFRSMIRQVAEALAEDGRFATDLDGLPRRADETVGYYSGAFGRYREARILTGLDGVDGVVNATSMYENTGISLNALHKSFADKASKPVLNMTFDGNENENDATKVDSFLYYI